MTALAQTDSITLLTGKPGSGKTLRVVHFCQQAIERGEVIAVCNLNGLKLPHIPFADPREWEDLAPGTVLVVDEAQQFFRSRRGGEVPPYLTAMETIRHKGIRLLLTTQQPDYLDAHLRGLVGTHEHLVRENGKSAVKIFRHSEVMENVRSERARGRYDNEVWEYPKGLFDLYESAQVHTVKRVFSARTKRGMMMAGAVVLMLGAIVWRGYAMVTDEGTADAAPVPPPGHQAPVGAQGQDKEPSNLTKLAPDSITEYVAGFVPRIQALPGSAPAYDDRPVVAHPAVYCIAGGRGQDGNGEERAPGYTCLTDQGTRYHLGEAEALDLARNGPLYDPYKQPQTSTAPRGGEGGNPPSAMAAPAAAVAPSASLIPGAQVSGYGDIGVGNKPQAAP